MTTRRRQQSIDTAVHCHYADDPVRRPRCDLTATVRYGTVTLRPSCQTARSTLGKGEPPVALPAGPAVDTPDWVAAAHAQANAAERTLTAAVTRASWSAIGTQLGVSRQAAQQHFTRASARESTTSATRAY